MVFLQLNILAKDRAELLKAFDDIRAELETTPDLEFFAMAVASNLPQYEVATEKTEATTIWEARRRELQAFEQEDYLATNNGS